ncbi:hypothetical protein CN692_13425 [Bacillus sp. AFS002410]|uniref:hypothetical protein n=1 Tax=Bacillus sp. AFS002410 TaxID=2033481 RepID=UPI000BF247D3|nr:hypothetical protein [Bacillus sp. AFS002410]PEJ57409.1 hypothetical protein CN692_13425 [Bacillus sp. AFS002410]
MEVKLLNVNDCAGMVKYIENKYKQGEMKGFVIGIVCNDGHFETGWGGDINFLEKLGLVSTIDHDIKYSVTND